VTLDKPFTDEASGKDAKRPQLEHLLSFVREGDTVSCLRGALRMGSLRHPHLCRDRVDQCLLGSIHPLQASMAEWILLAYGGGGVADRYMR
jgi:hypothetical protein